MIKSFSIQIQTTLTKYGEEIVANVLSNLKNADVHFPASHLKLNVITEYIDAVGYIFGEISLNAGEYLDSDYTIIFERRYAYSRPAAP